LQGIKSGDQGNFRPDQGNPYDRQTSHRIRDAALTSFPY
jgi:hypothetical protein